MREVGGGGSGGAGLRGERVALRHRREGVLPVRLRELLGSDELAVDGVDTRAAVALLDRLVDAAGPVGAWSASDRDAALAALHRTLWGDRIVASLRCPACEAMYDLSFELTALQRQLHAGVKAHRVVAPNRVEAAGRAWQLPASDDEEAAAESGAATGRASLLAIVKGAARSVAADDDAPLDGVDTADALAALEALAPLLDVDLDSTCAECDHAQLARFDVQSFVLQRLLDEREQLHADLHALADAYSWPLGEILAMPRSLRRSLVQRIDGSSTALA